MRWVTIWRLLFFSSILIFTSLNSLISLRKLHKTPITENQDRDFGQFCLILPNWANLSRLGRICQIHVATWISKNKQLHTAWAYQHNLSQKQYYYCKLQFVAHPHCQQLMENAWYDGLPDWVCSPRWHTAFMALYGLLIFLFFPILIPLYMVRVPKVDRYLKPAAQRFLT